MDLDLTLKSIVAVHTTVPDDAFTAGILGTERAGSGVVIRDSGLVLTIGYLVTEAEEVWLTSADGRVTAGHVLAYDQETGFGLVQALGKLDLPALELGDASKAKIGDPIVLAGGGPGQVTHGNIVGTQEFAGYWEYLIDKAIFTAPAHPSWGGASLIDADGKLIGIGSLLLQMSEARVVRDINMVVPIDLLPPILGDLTSYGKVNKPPRPWLGAYTAESDGKVVVLNVADGGPAAKAGVRRGDIVSDVRDQDIGGLADFYRKIWASGPAGTEIPIRVVRDSRGQWLRIKTADRNSFLKKPRLQ